MNPPLTRPTATVVAPVLYALGPATGLGGALFTAPDGLLVGSVEVSSRLLFRAAVNGPVRNTTGLSAFSGVDEASADVLFPAPVPDARNNASYAAAAAAKRGYVFLGAEVPPFAVDASQVPSAVAACPVRNASSHLLGVVSVYMAPARLAEGLSGLATPDVAFAVVGANGSAVLAVAPPVEGRAGGIRAVGDAHHTALGRALILLRDRGAFDSSNAEVEVEATGQWKGEGRGRSGEVTATRAPVQLSGSLNGASAGFFSPTAATWSLVVVQRSVPVGTELLSSLLLWTGVVAAVATALGISVMVVWSTGEVKGELQLKQQLEERTDEVLRARDEAQAANKAKSLFLANMSHEIRTPMTGILGLVDLMLDAADLSDEHRDNLRSVRHCGKTLLQLLNDILDLAKVEAGRLVLETIEFDLVYELESSMDLFAARMESKGIDFVMDVDPSVPRYVRGDPARLAQAINNLLSNAYKFTAKGFVVLRVAARPVRQSEVDAQRREAEEDAEARRLGRSRSRRRRKQRRRGKAGRDQEKHARSRAATETQTITTISPQAAMRRPPMLQATAKSRSEMGPTAASQKQAPRRSQVRRWLGLGHVVDGGARVHPGGNDGASTSGSSSTTGTSGSSSSSSGSRDSRSSRLFAGARHSVRLSLIPKRLRRGSAPVPGSLAAQQTQPKPALAPVKEEDEEEEDEDEEEDDDEEEGERGYGEEKKTAAGASSGDRRRAGGQDEEHGAGAGERRPVERAHEAKGAVKGRRRSRGRERPGASSAGASQSGLRRGTGPVASALATSDREATTGAAASGEGHASRKREKAFVAPGMKGDERLEEAAFRDAHGGVLWPDGTSVGSDTSSSVWNCSADGTDGEEQVQRQATSARPRQGSKGLLGNAAMPSGRQRWLAQDTGPGAAGEDPDPIIAYEVTVEVADSGAGIPPGRLDRIFRRFEQAETSTSRTHGGTGLGLGLVSVIARLMGGDVIARSCPGVGTTFFFSVRLDKPRAEGERLLASTSRDMGTAGAWIGAGGDGDGSKDSGGNTTDSFAGTESGAGGGHLSNSASPFFTTDKFPFVTADEGRLPPLAAQARCASASTEVKGGPGGDRADQGPRTRGRSSSSSGSQVEGQGALQRPVVRRLSPQEAPSIVPKPMRQPQAPVSRGTSPDTTSPGPGSSTGAGTGAGAGAGAGAETRMERGASGRSGNSSGSGGSGVSLGGGGSGFPPYLAPSRLSTVDEEGERHSTTAGSSEDAAKRHRYSGSNSRHMSGTGSVFTRVHDAKESVDEEEGEGALPRAESGSRPPLPTAAATAPPAAAAVAAETRAATATTGAVAAAVPRPTRPLLTAVASSAPVAAAAAPPMQAAGIRGELATIAIGDAGSTEASGVTAGAGYNAAATPPGGKAKPSRPPGGAAKAHQPGTVGLPAGQWAGHAASYRALVALEGRESCRVLGRRLRWPWGMGVTVVQGPEQVRRVLANAAKRGEPFDLAILQQRWTMSSEEEQRLRRLSRRMRRRLRARHQSVTSFDSYDVGGEPAPGPRGRAGTVDTVAVGGGGGGGGEDALAPSSHEPIPAVAGEGKSRTARDYRALMARHSLEDVKRSQWFGPSSVLVWVVPLREKSKSHALVESTGFDCAVTRPLHMNKIETRVRDAYRANVRKANGEPGASCTSLDARSHTSQASAQSQGLAARPTRARTFHGLSAAPSRSSSRPDASRAEAGRTPPTSTPHGSEHDSGYGGGSSPHSQAKAEREQEDADPSWERIAKGLQGDTREYGRSDVPGSRLGAGLRRQSSLGVPAADAKVVTYPLPRAGGGAGHGEVGAPWGRQLTQPSPTGSYSTVSATQGEQTGLSLPSLPAIPGLASMTDAPARAVDMPALPTLPGGPPALPTGQVGAVHEASSDSSDSDSSGEVAEDDATRSGRVLRVLVAEDNKINQKVVCQTLRPMGTLVTVAADGAEAVDEWQAARRRATRHDNPWLAFDVVFMDCQMPRMDGYEATRRIRELEAKEKGGARVNVIALTAHAMLSDKAKCLNAGMDDYLTKPVEKRKVAMALERVRLRKGRSVPGEGTCAGAGVGC